MTGNDDQDPDASFDNRLQSLVQYGEKILLFCKRLHLTFVPMLGAQKFRGGVECIR